MITHNFSGHMDNDEQREWMAEIIAQRQRQQQIEELRKLNGTQNSSASNEEPESYHWVIGIFIVVLLVMAAFAGSL
jgi:hypothetical protein